MNGLHCPFGNWDCPDVAGFPYEVNYDPVVFPLLNLIVLKRRQLGPAQPATEQQTKHSRVPLATERIWIDDIKELLTLL